MSEPRFFGPPMPMTLSDVLAQTGAVTGASDAARLFHGVAALGRAGPGALAVWTADQNRDELARTKAGGCFVTSDAQDLVPPETIALVTPDPAGAFAHISGAFYPDVGRPRSLFANQGISPSAFIHAEARLEPGVTVDPGVVIGPRAEIGSGTVIGANSVVGAEVRIGRSCAIGAHVTIACALIGNGVTIAPGVRIGQDGPPLADGPGAQIAGTGRVIIQDQVEIGANSTIDRGGLYDTVLGEGSRIGNLVHVARDRMIPRLGVVRPLH